VSFFPLGTPPMGVNFPRRNELIVQLAYRVCVVQASHQSGALNTATWARKHKKPVYGVPGEVDLPESQGIIHLLHSGARPMWSAEQIVEDLAPISRLTPKYEKKRNEKVDKPGRVVHLFDDTNRGGPPEREETPPPEGEEGAIFALLSDDPLHLDEVTALSDLPSRRVGELLLQLELIGRVEQLPGGYYRKIR
jgi:DNA processing protein